MKMKELISSLLLIGSVCVLMPLSAANPFNNPLNLFCENSEYTNGSAFQSNLNQVLDSLVGNVSTGGFNTSSGQNSHSTVYGFAQCRGDLNSSDCKQCVATAKAVIFEGCNKTSASMILDGCLLRYDNHSFSSNFNESADSIIMCNTGQNSQPQFAITAKYLLQKVLYKAAQSQIFFAAEQDGAPYNSTILIYSLAQCWEALSTEDCKTCLNFSLSEIYESCTAGAVGSRFASVNCYMRSELYPFFNPPIILPSPSPTKSPSKAKRSTVQLRVILGVAAATIGLIAAITLCKRIFLYRGKNWEHISQMREAEGSISLSATIANPELIFKYETLRGATSSFHPERKLGEGGFGSVFKGDLPDGREVAVKRLKIGSSQGDVEFLNEINLISRIQHKNLVKLLGCSVINSERLLVYEYLQNGSLDNIIFDIEKRHLLDWGQRYEIIVGTARGLAYLHEESEIRIIHRDIKASNILLDNKHKPKITDFGLAKLFEDDKTHVSTRVAGTFGYMAPEYVYRGQLTEKADVFSFGVLALEIISGRKNQSSPQDMEFLIERTWKLYNAERALEVMDPTLEGSYSLEEGIRVIQIGLLCTQAAATLRPSMSRVVTMLTSEKEHLPSPTSPPFIDVHSVGSTATSITPSDVHSAAAYSSSGIMEPR